MADQVVTSATNQGTLDCRPITYVKLHGTQRLLLLVDVHDVRPTAGQRIECSTRKASNVIT
jgi:hypothetical protein